jgi:hypothetical protein
VAAVAVDLEREERETIAELEMLGIILLVFLILILLGALPQAGFHDSGYGPSGLVGTILIIVLILVLLGKF